MSLGIAFLVSTLVFALAHRLAYLPRLGASKVAGRLAEAHTFTGPSAKPSPRSIEGRLAAAGIRTEHPRLVWALLAWGLPALALAAVLSAGFPHALAGSASVVAAIAVRRAVDGRARDRGRRIDEQLPMAYARLLSTLRANPDVAAGLLEVASSLEAERGPTPLADELRLAATEAASPDIGRDAALQGLQSRAASTSLANLGLLLERFGQTAAGQGGSFLDAIESAAGNVQGILEARARARAKSAEQLQTARLVPLLLAGTLLFFMNDPGFRTSFQLPLVQLALGVAVGVMYLGYVVIADLAREAV